MKDVALLQKDAETLRKIADDIEKGNIQTFVFIGKKRDEFISLTPFGLDETRELKNILDDAILDKFLKVNINRYIEYVED